MDFDAIAADIAGVTEDAKIEKLKAEIAELRKKYKTALGVIAGAEQAREAVESLGNISACKLPASKPRSKKKPEASVILAMSDWHVEERVFPDEVRGLNEYTLEIADKRIAAVVDGAERLIEHEKGITNIRRIVLWLGGDFITGHIHDELIEATQLAPLAACRWAGERIIGMVDRLSRLGVPLVIPTSSGNHGRSTQNRRIAGENEHSFEQHLYHTLAMAERRKNVTWLVGEGYHNIVDLDGFVVRFHHGHAMRGSGGFGGLVPGAAKMIAGWNAAQPVSLDVFGHLHSFTVGRNFVANGSLIGPGPYSDRLGCPADTPAQAMVVVDHSHNRVTKAMPIFVD